MSFFVSAHEGGKVTCETNSQMWTNYCRWWPEAVRAKCPVDDLYAKLSVTGLDGLSTSLHILVEMLYN